VRGIDPRDRVQEVHCTIAGLRLTVPAGHLDRCISVLTMIIPSADVGYCGMNHRACTPCMRVKQCWLAKNVTKTYFCRRWKLSGSSPSLRRYSLYFSPNAPPGKATSFPGNGMTTSNIEYLSTFSSVRVSTRGGCHGFLLPLRPEAGSSGVVVSVRPRNALK